MSPLDLLIVAGLVSAVVGGYRLGFLARITSWAGLALGVFLGALFLPEVATYFEDAESGVRVLAVIAFLLAAGMLGQGIGLAVGAALHATLRVGPDFRRYDRAAGGVLGAAGILVIFWILGPTLARAPGLASQWARGSAVLELLEVLAPDPPDTFNELSRLLGAGFPQVIPPLSSSPEVGSPPAESGISPEVHRRVVAATVKIEGQACRKVQEGSGFAAAPGLIVTNAHVVAGEDETTVTVNVDGRNLSGSVVVFDPDRDLAILRVPELGLDPLPIAAGAEGMEGAVYGNPGGGDLEVSPAAIRQQVTAVGRDIYDRHRTRRDVFILASNLEPGDSGGALVDTRGRAVGVAFAIAPDRSGTAYALTDSELAPVLEEAAQREQAVDTGPCLV